jgi:hypothetical protein
MQRDRKADRFRQSEEIRRNGYPVGDPCHYCRNHNETCIMDSNNRKCASCTRSGRTCEKRFHTEKEWRLLHEAEEKIVSSLADADKELDRLYPEVFELQSRLSEAQKKINTVLTRHNRLRKQQKLLKERGSKMLDHDTLIIDQLDTEGLCGVPSTPCPAEQLLTVTVSPLTERQMNEILNQVSPFPLSLPSVSDEILLSSHDNLSDSQHVSGSIF